MVSSSPRYTSTEGCTPFTSQSSYSDNIMVRDKFLGGISHAPLNMSLI